MNAVALTEVVRKFCEGLIKLVYLNLLWLLFSLVGLGIFGVVPATVALCKIQKCWLEEVHISSVFYQYWRSFKQHFIQSNLLAIVLTLIGSLIYFDLKFFIEQGGVLFQIISVFIFILSVWFMITVLYIVPIYVSYRLKLFGYIKYAFIIAMLNPLKTIGMAFSTWGMVYISLYFPQVLFSIGISLSFYMIMIISLQAIDRVKTYQQKLAKTV
ncbi:YesL family protein [Gracilibacillus saliphilus]|uniref:YesL family protein n=1 Tax=Gracilibacillus saliphilus TaxID=543890 RepID=UPI0013D67529|nr:DUF624 domain-containing protein [Gracilibacillus saliphilus]